MYDEPDQVDALPEHDVAEDDDDDDDDIDVINIDLDIDMGEDIPELSLGDLMGLGDDLPEEEDYVEEKTTADGTHIRKEVHSGPGFTSVRITSDGGSGDDSMPDGLDEIMKAMLGGAPPFIS